jgi:rubrerythrin
VKQEAYQWRRRAFVHKEEYPDAPLKSHLRTLSDIGEWERDLSENVSRLNEIIESGYEQDYKTRQDNLGWYGLKRTEFKRDFKTVQELNELVQRANEALSQAEEKRTGLESRIQGEMARIDTMLLEKQIENLLDCGRMGIKGHYYEEARKCFKQVLELDISNQEAIDGLARIDEIFSRRAIEPVEPIEAEIRTKLPLAKEISLRVNSAFEWIRKALEKYESRESARQEKRRIVEERKRVWYGEMVCGRCGYGWQSRRRAPPAQCPSCGSRTISPVLTQQSKRQPEWSKLAILVGGLLMLLCLCNGFASLISPTPEATQTPAPTNTSSLLPTRTLRPTPTLRPPTSTPRPPTPTPMPTNTPKPLATPTSSLRVPLI